MGTTTIKIWDKTRRKLKLMAAERDIPMTELIDYLVDNEQSTQDNPKKPALCPLCKAKY